MGGEKRREKKEGEKGWESVREGEVEGKWGKACFKYMGRHLVA